MGSENTSRLFVERAPRTATNWIAIIRTFEGIEIPCNVKDVSKTGARVGVPASYHLPESFMLKVIGIGFVCRVSLVWRNENYAGVRIEQVGKIAPKSEETADIKSEAVNSSYKASGTRRSRVSSF